MEVDVEAKRRKLSSGWALRQRERNGEENGKVERIEKAKENAERKKKTMEFNGEIHEKGEKGSVDGDLFAIPVSPSQKKVPKLNNQQIAELYSNCLNLSTHNVLKIYLNSVKKNPKMTFLSSPRKLIKQILGRSISLIILMTLSSLMHKTLQLKE